MKFIVAYEKKSSFDLTKEIYFYKYKCPKKFIGTCCIRPQRGFFI